MAPCCIIHFFFYADLSVRSQDLIREYKVTLLKNKTSRIFLYKFDLSFYLKQPEFFFHLHKSFNSCIKHI